MRHAQLNAQTIALKYGLKTVPGSGWAMQLASYLFLRRVWSEDQLYLQQWVNSIGSGVSGAPSQLLLFPEGTNLTAGLCIAAVPCPAHCCLVLCLSLSSASVSIDPPSLPPHSWAV
jgi:1-acyl-sn-glycerol-3-phosphate acyltransferase